MSRFFAQAFQKRSLFQLLASPVGILHPLMLLIAVLIAALAPLGCVVPLGPEFQDPPSASNSPPYFESSDPVFEVQRTAPQDFYVTVRDVNPRDRLYVRWASDYPAFLQAQSRLLADIETTAGQLPVYAVPANCEKFAKTDSPLHRLVVIVSDRPFVKDPSMTNNPDYRYNVTKDGNVPIVAGWVVQCP